MTNGVTRRTLIVGGLGAVGACAVGVAATNSAAVQRRLGLTGPDGTVPDVPAASDVTVHPWGIVVTPPGAWAVDLPMCLVLHWRGSSARGLLDLGLPAFLAAAGHQFALVAVDGGESYWIGNVGAMLTDDLPRHLDAARLRAPEAAVGISMGGFGALALATRTPLRAVAGISPALFPSWPDARHALPSEEAWKVNEPLLHVADLQPGTAVGIWCGQQDPFHAAAHRYAELADPEVASFEPGDHTDGYWRRVLPAVLDFVGAHLAGA
jgi:hypothetical protein